jgi:arylsulfatase A-like enzyme
LLGGHKPAGPLRGGKGTLWEGGTRVPFLVRWPQRVRPGVSDAVVSQVDFCATFGALVGAKLSPDDAPDSFNLLPALLGESRQGREYVLEHSGVVALREGRWKLVPPGPKSKSTAYALYDLDADIGESTNIASRHPDLVAQLTKKLESLKAQPRTRPE